MFFPYPIFHSWVRFLWDFPLSWCQYITTWVGRYTNDKLLPSSKSFASWSLLASSPMGLLIIPFRSGFILTAVTSGSLARGHYYYEFIRLLAPHLVWFGFPCHTLVDQTHLRVLYFCRPRTIPDLPRSASLPFYNRSDSNHMVYSYPFGLPQESAGSPPYTMPNRANLRFGPVVRY